MAGGPRNKPGPYTLALAEILRVERVRARVTLQEMADRLGISKGQVSKMLNGHVSIEFDHAEIMCEMVGRSFIDVIREVEIAALRLSFDE